MSRSDHLINGFAKCTPGLPPEPRGDWSAVLHSGRRRCKPASCRGLVVFDDVAERQA